MKAKQWLLIPAILTIGIIVLAYVAYNQLISSTTLTKTDIETRIAALYGGKVETISKVGSHYNVTFAVDDYIYEVVANEEYGTFEQLVLLKEGTPVQTEKPAAPDENPASQQPEPIPNPKPPAKKERLTAAEAIAIAKKQATGTVEDVEFYTNTNGGYYIIEIENDAEDGEDIKLQIHAITGKILSVSFDD